VFAGQDYARVFHLPATPVRELVERAKQATGVPVVRVVGDLDRRIERIGLPWGGLGLFVNIGFMQQLVENGAEAGIAGETDEYAMRFAEDAGLALIETSHAACENIGLRHFAAMLADAHPGMNVAFHECGPGWSASSTNNRT
jgi:putative NIF3 family GTP cyclohydrolase 1 type 2